MILTQMDVFINLKNKGGIVAEFELIVKENLDVALLFTETDGLKKKNRK